MIKKDQFIDLNEMLGGEIFFQQSGDVEEVFHQDELVQLHPFGVSLSTDVHRPFLLLKDAKKELTLPVAINPLEAGVTLTQNNKSVAPTTPYKFVQELMKSLAIEIKQCVFVQIKGPVQYVRLYLSGHPKVSSIKLRADEAMSLCLHFNVPIFASRVFINKSKLMNAQIEGLTEGMLKNQKILVKNHPYIM